MHKQKIQVTIFLLFLTIAAMPQAAKKNGQIDLKITDNDTMHVITATVTDSATTKPLQNVELTFFVQRMFGVMKVGNATTDTTGIATTEFLKNIRADENGKVILITKVEDNDVMNDKVMQMTMNPDLAHAQNKPVPRAMIGHYAPWWLVITFTLIIGTVSFVFVYILYLIYRIKKAAGMQIIS